MAPLTVLYDIDCGFCRATLGALLLLDRRRRLVPVALQDDRAPQLLPGEAETERLAAVHTARPGEPQQAGGAALAAILAEVPGGGPVAALLRRFPGAAERSYRLVADNRSRLSRFVPRALVRRADRLIARRA